MGDMKQPAEQVKWLSSGTRGVGVLVSDTMMFQRYGPDASDPELGSFYGLALPLLMRGIPVEPVQMETADLTPYKVLLLTYEGQKPPNPTLHTTISKWVRAGGGLVVVDDDKDSFAQVREWWNSGDRKYQTPRHDLFDVLDVPRHKVGATKVGKGVVIYANKSPAALSHSRDGADQVRQVTREAMNAVGESWRETGALVLRRGPYVVASGLDDPTTSSPRFVIRGRFIPLFDAALPVVTDYSITPGDRALLVDVDTMPPTSVVAAACRVRDTHVASRAMDFAIDGIDQTQAIICIKLPTEPKSVSIDGSMLSNDSFSVQGGLLRIRVTNQVNPRRLSVAW